MGRKKRKEKTKITEEKKPEKKSIPQKEYKVDETFPLAQWGIDVYHRFMKSNDREFAVAYKVPTANLSSELMVTNYKTEAIKACENAALDRGLKPNANSVEIKILPLGYETIIKASFKLIDATGKRSIQRENIPMPKKEGLFVEDG